MQTRPGLTVTLLTAGMFLAITIFTFVAPLLVDIARDLRTTVPVAGQLMAAMSIPWALAAPLIGPLSDRLGRRPVLMVGATGMACTTIAAAFADSLTTMLVLRFLSGLAGAATAPMLLASVGDFFDGPARVRAFGWVNGGWALAAIVGVPLAALIAGATHWRVSFAAIGSVMLVLVLVLTRVRFPRPRQQPVGYRATYARLVRRLPVWLALTCNAAERALYAAVATYVPPFLIEHYGLSLDAVAPVLALSAVGGLVGNLAGGWSAGRIVPPRLFAICQGGAGMLALVVLSGVVPLVATAFLIWAFGAINAYSRPAFLSLVTDVGGDARGSMIGMLATSNQSGYAFGAAAGGLALALGSYAGLSVFTLAAGLAAALTAAALGIAIGAKPRPVTEGP
jgi:predicted MFS family arabinose efflux permease